MFSNSFTLRLMELNHLHVNNLMLVMFAILDIFMQNDCTFLSFPHRKIAQISEITSLNTQTVQYLQTEEGERAWCSETIKAKRSKKKIRHEPLLLFLSLWHCLVVHIYWDFCLGQAMTEPHRKRGDTETERETMMRAEERQMKEG